MVVDVEPVDDPHRQPSQQIARGATYDELHRQRAQDRGHLHAVRLNELNQHDGQHIGHRVVAAALQLQHRAQVVLEVHLLRAQDGEYRGRIRTRHGGGQQQRGQQAKVDVGPAHPREPADEEPREQRREQHACRREHDALRHHRPNVGQAGIHSARKEDDAERHHANELRLARVVKLQAQPVAAHQHAHQQEEQQRGHPKPVARLTHHDTYKQQDGPHQQNIFSSKPHRRLYNRKLFKTEGASHSSLNYEQFGYKVSSSPRQKQILKPLKMMIYNISFSA